MYIVTAKEMYEMDRYTIQEMGLDERILMENAGRAIAGRMMETVSRQNKIGVLVGSGNNGGDGFVIARTLKNRGYDVVIVQIVSNEKITGTALYHKKLWINMAGTLSVTTDPEEICGEMQQWDVVIDAMIGIGVHDTLRDPVASIVSHVNEKASYVISVDIPTGLPADEGLNEFLAIKADYTFVIEAVKMSLFVQHTAPFYGNWEVVSIGIPISQLAKTLKRQVWGQSCLRQTMPKRARYAHKGNHGKGLVIGGSREMPGSIALTAKASLRAGAGLVTVGTTEAAISSIASICSEATYYALPDDKEHVPTDDFHAVAIGMGLGRDQSAEQLVTNQLQANVPLLIDADGLYHAKANFSLLYHREQTTVVTPHPGEMAMLMDISIRELLQNPFHYAAQLATEQQIYVVLKGAHTIVTSPNGKQAVNQTGNQGLAKGGSGDVLSGIILAMMMQHDDAFQALCNACFLHGAAADLQVTNNHSYYDLLATDVIAGIPLAFRTCLSLS